MVRLALGLAALALLSVLPGASALISVDEGDLTGCAHFERESDQGPVHASQEEPGVFVGVPAQTLGDLVPSEDGNGVPIEGLVGIGGDSGYNGAGVFVRNRDCELPGVGTPSS
jgi:hypothetical protein